MASGTTEIARKIEQELLARIGGAAVLSASDRQLIAACCADAAQLQVRAMLTDNAPAAQAALLAEKAHVQAQLANLAATAANEIAQVFWEVVRTMARAAFTIAVTAV